MSEMHTPNIAATATTPPEQPPTLTGVVDWDRIAIEDQRRKELVDAALDEMAARQRAMHIAQQEARERAANMPLDGDPAERQARRDLLRSVRAQIEASAEAQRAAEDAVPYRDVAPEVIERIRAEHDRWVVPEDADSFDMEDLGEPPVPYGAPRAYSPATGQPVRQDEPAFLEHASELIGCVMGSPCPVEALRRLEWAPGKELRRKDGSRAPKRQRAPFDLLMIGA